MPEFAEPSSNPKDPGMKAIMYHYVRPGSLGWERLKYLHLDNFRRQLDWFAQNVGFVSREEFQESLVSGEPGSGAILTFDDGFADHYSYVFPELVSRNLWAIFFIPTAVYSNRRLLDVHRIHLITARCGGAACLAAVNEVVTDDMLADAHVDEFKVRTYNRFDDDADIIAFKRVLNYFIGYEYREQALDRIAAKLKVKLPSAADFYVSPSQLKEMTESGMQIGSHSVNHLVMSKIDRDQQRREIESSFEYLNRVAGTRVETFCYPYGGFHSFTGETEALLTQAGCRCAFNIEPRDISSEDLRSRVQALPRYDCNHFPFGVAGMA
jgi:peptidoglycan/xylan/chitin deacetylase (PgdA/CDA1 family)